MLPCSCLTESLVVDQSVPSSGTLQQDLDTLPDILEESVPAYVLVRLDDPPTEWLLVSYVPDDSKVRDKVHLSKSSRIPVPNAYIFVDVIRVHTQQPN